MRLFLWFSNTVIISWISTNVWGVVQYNSVEKKSVFNKSALKTHLISEISSLSGLFSCLAFLTRQPKRSNDTNLQSPFLVYFDIKSQHDPLVGASRAFDTCFTGVWLLDWPLKRTFVPSLLLKRRRRNGKKEQRRPLVVLQRLCSSVFNWRTDVGDEGRQIKGCLPLGLRLLLHPPVAGLLCLR